MKTKEEILANHLIKVSPFGTATVSNPVVNKAMVNAMQDYAEQYHLSQLSEVKGLPEPTSKEIVDATEKCVESCRLTGKRHKEAVRFGFAWGVEFCKKLMRSEASKVIASLQAQLEEARKPVIDMIPYRKNENFAPCGEILPECECKTDGEAAFCNTRCDRYNK